MERLFEPSTLSVLLLFGLPIVAVICAAWCKAQKIKSDNSFRCRLVDAGLSVEEIVRILNTANSKKKSKS